MREAGVREAILDCCQRQEAQFDGRVGCESFAQPSTRSLYNDWEGDMGLVGSQRPMFRFCAPNRPGNLRMWNATLNLIPVRYQQSRAVSQLSIPTTS